MDKEKILSVNELRDYDHAFLNTEGVAYFAKAFGVTLTPRRYWANPKDPKGLMLPDGKKSEIGMDAHIMAEEICRQVLGVNPAACISGRGFALRKCCDALHEHFMHVKPGSNQRRKRRS
jgi:hypothetical protein